MAMRPIAWPEVDLRVGLLSHHWPLQGHGRPGHWASPSAAASSGSMLSALGARQSDAFRAEVLQAGENRPVSAFVALVGERPVSFAVYGVTGRNVSALRMPPDYRRRGLGGVLLRLCLQDLRDQGWRVADISWAGPVHYYARAVDAVVHKVYWVFTKELGEGATANRQD